MPKRCGGLDFGAATRALVNPPGNERQALASRGGRPKDFRRQNEKRIEEAQEKGRAKREAAALKVDAKNRLGTAAASRPSTASTARTDSTALYQPETGAAPTLHVCFSPPPSARAAAPSPAGMPAPRADDSALSHETTLDRSSSSASARCPLSPGEILLPGGDGELLLLDRADDEGCRIPLCIPALHLPPPPGGGGGGASSRAPSELVRKGGRPDPFKTSFLANNRYQVHFTPTGMPYTSCASPRVSRARDPARDPHPPASRPASSSRPSSSAPSHRAGEVPAYLAARKLELQRAADQRALLAAAPKAPEGMRIVPEWEQREAERRLRGELARLGGEYSRLPLGSAASFGQRARRDGLERAMDAVERTLGLLGKAKGGPLVVPEGESLLTDVGMVAAAAPKRASEAERIRTMQTNPTPII